MTNDNTMELIPLSQLSDILLDENELQLFLHFDENRNHFSEKHSYEEYYEQLDSYVASLVEVRNMPTAELLITSFVENFLKKNLDTDKFYGSKLLKVSLQHPESVSKLECLQFIVDYYQKNRKQIETHYLKLFAKKSFSFNEYSWNILSNLIYFNCDENFVFHLFFNGNSILKDYLVRYYGVYFQLEKLSYNQLISFQPYFSLLLNNFYNQYYLSKRSLACQTEKKEQYILNCIKSSDENILFALSHIHFKDSAYIKELIFSIKDFNCLTFSSFTGDSSLALLGLSYLDFILKKCSQKTIYSILFHFKDDEIKEGFSQNLYLLLLLNMKNKEIRKQFIVQFMHREKRFNYKTLYNLLITMDSNDVLDLLQNSLVITNFNCYEMAFLLKALNFSYDTILKFVNDNYLLNFSSYQDIYRQYVDKLQEELQTGSSLRYTNGLYYAWSSGTPCLLDLISIEDVIKNLFSKDNFDKKIDISTMQSILNYYFNYNLDHEVDILFSSPIEFKSTTLNGGYRYELHQIVLNDSNIKSIPRENLTMISTFFHEKNHYLQMKKIGELDANYHLIQIAKEYLMYQSLAYKGKEAISSENYSRMEIECDANLRGIIETLAFLNHVNKDYLKKVYNSKKSELKDYLKLKQAIERKDFQNNMYYDTDYYFDLYTTKEDVRKFIKKCPILLYEYLPQGEKKSALDLLMDYNQCKQIYETLSASGKNFDKRDSVRKLRVYELLLDKRKSFVSFDGEIICNQKERFNDWRLLLDALIKNMPNQIQIVDYLISSVRSYIDVATFNDLQNTKEFFISLSSKLNSVFPLEMQSISCEDFLDHLIQYRNYLFHDHLNSKSL